ncbi:polysaccharide biosynthesis protein [Gordonia sp. YC-JH1]|nr:polysaccharide biosynthesis protein [Gordonia sp. YC-JH1]
MQSIAQRPGTLVSMVDAATPRRGSTVRSVGWVTAGSLLANLLAYVVQVPASRVLGPDAFGEFSVLNAAMLIASVPALALQAVVAREVVRGTPSRRLWALIGVVFGVVALVSVFAVAAMMRIAHTDLGPTAAALAGAAPLAVVSGGQGLLQGAGRFRLLGAVLAGVGLLRSVPVVGAVYAGADAAGALAAGTLGTAVAAALAAAVAAAAIGPAERSRGAAAPGSRLTLSAVVAASGVQFVMIVAVSVDLLLSRSVLTAGDAGVYALGAVATKAAFWLPQAIGVVVYPRLADPVRSAAALRGAVGVLALTGLVTTLIAAVGGGLVPVVISDDYRPVAGLMWLFALTGALLAVLQLMLLTAIARDRARGAIPALVVLVVEVSVILTAVDSVAGLVAVAAGAAACAVAATGAWLTAS